MQQLIELRDGQPLVFSLLGDLYVLPIAGGEATRITSGPAYDVQPRFSPDGRSIAFASDRSGIENLWVCDLDGKNARAVSSDKASTVSAPAWSPDGEYLVGHKRLTDLSTLGTVEPWMWHLKGGQGVQLTKMDDQPDAADPVFSPDGRFVYFSARDSRYQYDRNVNLEIWQMKRLDRRTGQVAPVTGEFGGAAAPAFSKDGKTLTFVRRVRGKTRIEAVARRSSCCPREPPMTSPDPEQAQVASTQLLTGSFPVPSDAIAPESPETGRAARSQLPAGRYLNPHQGRLLPRYLMLLSKSLSCQHKNQDEESVESLLPHILNGAPRRPAPLLLESLFRI